VLRYLTVDWTLIAQFHLWLFPAARMPFNELKNGMLHRVSATEETSNFNELDGDSKNHHIRWRDGSQPYLRSCGTLG
jgi:hypothetical protein